MLAGLEISWAKIALSH